MEEKQFYRNLKEETFDESSCFLCGHLCDGTTNEHIFPKWLQRKYDLWDKKLEITNGTTVPYRYITVPCCSKCNNEYLSRMEAKFQKLLDREFKSLTLEDEIIIFQWTAKILYATRYKELSLLYDRKDPNLGKIITPKDLESYSSLHLFLQSIRFTTIFNLPKPWSIFILKCEDEEFFYHNNISALFLAMKFGSVALTIVYEDNNLIENFMYGFKRLEEYKLNFPQLLEVNCNILYSAIIKKNHPHYLSTFDEQNQLLIINTIGNLFSREWNDIEYSHYFDLLLKSCGFDKGLNAIPAAGSCTSFLIDENGEHITKKLFEK